MKTNRWIIVGALGAWLISSAVQAQQPGSIPTYAPPAPIPVNGELPTDHGPPGPPLNVLSDYLQYNSNGAGVKRDCCFGHLNLWTPMYTELYLRAGPAVPVGGETLTRELRTGWTIIGGSRALFFDPTLTAAWTVDPHIINTNESGGHQETRFPITTFSNGVRNTFGSNGVPGVTVKASNRTLVGLGFGREWYLWNSADSPDCQWRVGVDVGGRYGSERLDLNETRHLTDVISGFYFAVHTDLEIPTHRGIFFTGIRLEFAQTYSDVLQQNSNTEDINLLWTFGIRF